MKCGLLGRKLGHSYSPQIHESLGHYAYDLYEREPEQLESFLRKSDLTGLNVTIPYKKAVIPYLDTVDALAERLGSVNTIVRKSDGTLHGYNTDYDGFLSMVNRSGLKPAGKKVLILGTGGAASTASAVMADLGAMVVCISRTGKNNYQNLSLHADACIIVNATPVGMYPNNGIAPVEIQQFPQLEGVLDLVYNPAKTRLLLDCQTHNIPAFNGLWMLVAQAKRAAEYFMDRPLPNEIIGSIYNRLRQQTENIVLIGMAGCGKSTIGRMLAHMCGKEFADSDEEVVKLAGKPIADIFAQDGEAAFRDLETRVLTNLGKQSGLVIATGGGCVTRTQNLPLLRQNGCIVWIQRDVHDLPTDGRPLSQRCDPAVLYTQRLPLYKAFSDLVVVNDAACQQTAEKLLAQWEERT